MKLVKAMLMLVILCVVVAAAAPMAQGQGTVKDAAKVKVADFGWFTGRWIGHLQNNAIAEQICSTPESGEMLCLFRVFVQGQPVMFEMYTIYDSPTGLEIRSRVFPTDLGEKAVQPPLLMTLQKFSDKEIVFAGAPGTEVATSTLTRDSSTTMNGVIMFNDQKEAHVKVRWEKVAYDSKVDYNPPAAKQ
jgi:hypothetical protein